MQCMKCGKDTPAGSAFCEECVAQMEKYPIKPGTVVQLPRRSKQVSQKKANARRSAMPPEEQVVRLKRLVRILIILWLVTVLTAAAVGYWIVKQYEEKTDSYLPGQNYSSMTDATGSEDD